MIGILLPIGIGIQVLVGGIGFFMLLGGIVLHIAWLQS